MKKAIVSAILASLFISQQGLAEDTQPSKKLYLNTDLGFNVEGYNYNQKSLPCEVDKYLVDKIVSKGQENNIEVNTVSTGDSITEADVPLMAIEINHLAMGKEGFNFGKKVSSSVLPSMQVTVGLLRPEQYGGDVLADHSCAILTIQQVSPAKSDILDMGTYGVTVCDATRKCLNDLSSDIVDWVAPQL